MKTFLQDSPAQPRSSLIMPRQSPKASGVARAIASPTQPRSYAHGQVRGDVRDHAVHTTMCI